MVPSKPAQYAGLGTVVLRQGGYKPCRTMPHTPPPIPHFGAPPLTTMTQHTVRIWDLPTRIFHWALAACIVALVITAKVGGNAMVWHFRLGYTVLALLVFRAVWGLMGGRWSRFSAFLY